jgi:hypothetical protein
MPTEPKPEVSAPEHADDAVQVQPLAPVPRYCAKCHTYGPEKGPCPKCGRSVLCG